MKFEFKEIQDAKVVVSGKQYNVRIPRVKDRRALKQSLVGLDENSDESFQVMIDWLDNLGFPKEVTEDLRLEDLVEFVEELSGTKKK